MDIACKQAWLQAHPMRIASSQTAAGAPATYRCSRICIIQAGTPIEALIQYSLYTARCA